MKVRVRKYNLSSLQDDPEFLQELELELLDLDIDIETKVQMDYAEARYKEQEAIKDKYEDEYYRLFPDDPFVCCADDVDNTPAFDPQIMTAFYLWGIEHKRHWWEWPDLPASYQPSDIPRSDLY